MDARDEIHRLERLANLLDAQFGIPGTRLRLGLDALIGLIPGVGDAVTAAPAIYIIHRAERLGAPGHVLARMVVNLLADTLIGAIPLVGDLFDIGFKANRRNVSLLKRHLEEVERSRRNGPTLNRS